MAITTQVTLQGASLGNSLQALLNCEEIVPGSAPSYQTCKIVYSFHPLGKKLADSPIVKAQAKGRDISVGEDPQGRVKGAFLAEAYRMKTDATILNLGRQARVYGISSLGLVVEGENSAAPIDFETIAGKAISWNVFDPLNTAGSLVLNQNPNALDFQKVGGDITVQGQKYHRSRFATLLHEDPIYIEFTTSAFGYVGRSVYQRPLYPLKSYLNTMVANDLVAVKAGVLIAILKRVSSWADQIIAGIAGIKRNFVREAVTGSVISIETEEKIESLNLENVNAAMSESRSNIIKDIATGADMPATMIDQETFVSGFGEGTEDSAREVQFVEGIRKWIDPAYTLMDKVCMYRAWTPAFFEALKKDIPDAYGDMDYQTAFQGWRNQFTASWPPLIEEPESERIKVDAVKLQAAIDLLVSLVPLLDPENKAALIQVVVDNFNDLKRIFSVKFDLDIDLLLEHLEEQAE